MSILDKGIIVEEEKYKKMLIEGFERVSPLIYLNLDQKLSILKNIKMVKFVEKNLLYSGMEGYNDDDQYSCFILIEGEIHFFDNNQKSFVDLVNDICFFGYDGPIFKKRLNTVLIEKNSVIGIIEMKDFLEFLNPFSQFATFISRNIRYKDKIFDNLNNFKNYIINSTDKGPLSIGLLLKYYKNFKSCMHQKSNSEEIDFTAWSYALMRLPPNVFETFVYVLVNKAPKILSSSEELSKLLIPKIIIPARNRDVYKYLEGKALVMVRDMETDVLDFICNICIHIIESQKLRKLILSPITFQKMYESRNNVNDTIDIIQNQMGKKLKIEEIIIIKKCFGDNFWEKLINLSLHYQDYSISINKSTVIDRDPVENWVQNLWKISKSLLGITSSLDEISDLVVDIIQGSKKALVSCLSPHIYKNKEIILKWAKDSNIVTKTTKFLCKNDELLAYAYHYYIAFPDKNKEKEEMEKDSGICYIDRTFSTGVKVLLINPNKLNPDYCDPNIKIKPASKNHLILHIGYTFGAQSYQIIKPLLMLFGPKARSLNIVGKAGGLIGSRMDILVADRMIFDKNNDLCNVNFGNISKEELAKETNTNIHIGPVLTVAGTILQNSELLNFYKYVMGCIGLEMEGYYFAKEVENCIKHGLLKKNFITRCFYYLSDLPLDPLQNLTQEEGHVSWDEGVGSVNAIQRFILKQIFT